MTVRRMRSGDRAAFTLIELMMVVLIIAVLVAMLSAAVSKVMGTVPVVQTSTDIAQLSAALHSFMADFQLSEPPPSTLTLNETAPFAADAQSVAFLMKAFGKNLGPTDWDGSGGTPSGTWTLTGEQCLIFYLTGIPNTSVTTAQIAAAQPPTYQGQGFSYSKVNPAISGGKRHGPYYNFRTSTQNSLGVWSRGLAPQSTNPNAKQFLVYYDAYATKNTSTPIAYFSAAGGVNNLYAINTMIGATPYYTIASPTIQYINPNTYQIISAGKNHLFGNGNMTGGVAIEPGDDDQANFSSSKLGAGQN